MAQLSGPNASPVTGSTPLAPYLARWSLSGSCRSWVLTKVCVTVGRAPGADVVLDDDPLVSRLHFTLELTGGVWTAVDNGLSRNGTFVNERRVSGRMQLEDRDQIRAGRTRLMFCWPGQAVLEHTLVGEPLFAAWRMTAAQHAVLVALCRPYADGGSPWSTPATNHEIAEHLSLSVDAVKTHLRALFHLYGIEQLPQNEKRARLAHLAETSGLLPTSPRTPEGRTRT